MRACELFYSSKDSDELSSLRSASTAGCGGIPPVTEINGGRDVVVSGWGHDVSPPPTLSQRLIALRG